MEAKVPPKYWTMVAALCGSYIKTATGKDTRERTLEFCMI